MKVTLKLTFCEFYSLKCARKGKNIIRAIKVKEAKRISE